MFKTGVFSLSHDPQTINDRNRDLDEDSDNIVGFAWEKRPDPDKAAFGVEFFRLDNTWVGPGTANGEVRTRVLLFTAKRYQETVAFIYPYVGVGMGVVHANASGMDFDPGLGLALQVSGGVEFRWQIFGIYTELKGLYAKSGDFWGDEMNASGIGAFAGLTFRF